MKNNFIVIRIYFDLIIISIIIAMHRYREVILIRVEDYFCTTIFVLFGRNTTIII